MAWSERFVTPTGAGDHSGSSEANALTLAEAVALAGASLSFNVQAATYALTTTILTLAIAGPRRWRGYKTVAGDMDGEPTGVRVPGTDIPWWQFTDGVVSITGAQQQLSNLAITTARASAACSISGEQVRLDRVRVENAGTVVDSVALYAAAANWCASRCWFKAAAQGNVVRVDFPGFLVGCAIRGGNHGVLLQSGAVILHCTFDDNAGHGIFVANADTARTMTAVVGCTVYSAGLNGVSVTAINEPSSSMLVADCLFSQGAFYGIANGIGEFRTHRTNNDFYLNSSGKETGFGDNPSFAEQVETSQPFANAPAHDLSLVSTAKAVRAGCPGMFEAETYRGYFDIGACQEASMTATEVAAAVWTPLRSAYNAGGTMGEAQTSIIAIQGTVNALSGRIPSTLSTGRMRSVVETVDAPAVTQIQAGLATAAAVQALQTDTDDLQTRLPAALVAGRMNSLTEAFSPAALVEIMNTIWGATLPGALTGNRAGAILGTRLPELVSGRMPSVVQAMDADTLTANALAADAVTEIVRGVWDEQLAQHTVAGSAAELIWDMSAAIGARLDVAVSTRLATSAYVVPPTVTAITDSVWDEVLAEHLQTGSTGEALSDAAAGGGGGGDPALIAAAVWEELLAGHTVVGSAGATLSAAGSAGDPWITILPGTYPAGTAGGILGALDTVPSDLGELSTDLASVQTDTNDIQMRLPAALVGAKMDSVVGPVSLTPGQSVGLTPAAIDAILDEVIEGAQTMRTILRILLASQGGRVNGAATAEIRIRDTLNTKDRIIAAVDADGNRSSVVLDGA